MRRISQGNDCDTVANLLNSSYDFLSSRMRGSDLDGEIIGLNEKGC